jgi:hypothetical protein
MIAIYFPGGVYEKNIESLLSWLQPLTIKIGI